MANTSRPYSYCDYMCKVDMNLFARKHRGETGHFEPYPLRHLKNFSDEVLDEYSQKDPICCGPVVKTSKEVFALIGR